MEKIPNNRSQEKENLWQAEKEIVDKITDRLGLEIDEGIKDTVIALRLLGINTTASHEGKIDRYPIPYIDINSPESIKLIQERNQKIEELKSDEEKDIFKEVKKLWREIQLTEDEVVEKELQLKVDSLEQKLSTFKYPKSDEITQLGARVKSQNLIEQHKVEELLQSFYENRVVSHEIRLALEIHGFGGIRLQSAGAEVQEGETDDSKIRERLTEFQGEMNAFTEFLKAKFFE